MPNWGVRLSRQSRMLGHVGGRAEMETLTEGDRLPWRAIGGVLLFGLAQLALLVSGLGGPNVTAVLDVVQQVCGVSVAILCCFWDGHSFGSLSLPAARTDGRQFVPRLAVAALVAIFTGIVIDLIYAAVTGNGTPTPFWDDACYLSGYCLFLPTVWLLAGLSRSLTRSLSTLLDALIVLCAIVAVTWTPVLHPILQQSTTSIATKTVYALYPLVSCLVLASVVLAWMETRDRKRRQSLLLLSFAAGFLAPSTSANTIASLAGNYHLGYPSDAGWPVALMLCGLTVAVVRRQLAAEAAAPPAVRTPIAGDTDDAQPLWRVLLPSALLVVVVLAAIAEWLANGRTMTNDVLAIHAVLATLVVARQVVALVENHRLTTALCAREERLSYQATHDLATGLPNRAALELELGRTIESTRDTAHSGALLLLGLDRLAQIKSTLGHHAGDQLVGTLAARLRSAVHTGASVARLGDDELAVILPGVDAEHVREHGETILAALEESIVVLDQTVAARVSVGVVLCPQHGDEPALLLQRAYVALYAARRDQRAYVCYDPTLDGRDSDQLALLAELRTAIEDGILILHYQPKVSLASGQLSGVEALVRWPHPSKGLIPPDRFIPLAEQTGLIVPLTERVLAAALAQSAAWAARDLEIPVAVNLSMRNLRDPALPGTIERLLAEHGVPPSRLCLELTESMIMSDTRGTQAALDYLAGMGIRLSIDDFGTGYSSLAYLSKLPVHELKIDRSFVQHLPAQPQNQTIVASTIGLAHSLGLDVVTEGVEDVETWNLLMALGADYAQGYYISRPVPADAIPRPIIAWSDRYLVNVPEIDLEHRQLVELINQLHSAMNRGSAGESLGDVLSGVLDYAHIHFATEERLMRQHAYPGEAQHRAAHEGLAQHVVGLHTRFRQGEPVIALQLAQFLSDWLADHIMGLDKDLGTFLATAVQRDLAAPAASSLI